MDEDKIVDAIDEGKIVKVRESYAKQEGLPILKKPRMQDVKERVEVISHYSTTKTEDKRPIKDYLDRPLNWRKDQVIQELVENFHWIIGRERRRKSLTRKQLARLTNEKEDHIKMIEYGVLPTHDFVLINKIQDALGINLRKDKKDFNIPVRKLIEEKSQPKQNKELIDNDIEILEDEI